jgi:hypothetical protein
MSDSIELLIDLFALSLCSWGLSGLYSIFSVMKFIVKRYEQETDLLNTIYFKEHATFTRSMPNFFSSAIYTSHLLTFIWGWNYFRKRKVYQDIKEPTFVTHNFTKKEIRKVKRYAFSFLILIFHVIAYYVFRSIWPEEFN